MGFVVDFIALSGIYGQANFNFSALQIFAGSTVHIGNMIIEWKDLTLIILVYVFIIFGLIDLADMFQNDGTGEFWVKGAMLTVPITLTAFWLLVFAPFGSAIFRRRLFWVALSALILLTLERSMKDGCLVALLWPLLSTPAIAFVEKIASGFNWWQAILTGLGLSILAMLLPYLLKVFYGIFNIFFYDTRGTSLVRR